MRAVFSFVVVAVIVSSTISMAQSKPGGQSNIRGVWQVAEVTTTGPNASTNSKPQPGLVIFTAKHYSMVRLGGTDARTALAAAKDPSHPTDAEKLAAAEHWAPLTAQSGTYELSGDKLTTHPLVAKNATVMAPGAFATYSIKVDGKTLTMTNTGGTSGAATNPTTTKLTRLE